MPVNLNNLRHPKRDMLWVAAAGPGSNVIQALLWAVLVRALFDPANEAVNYWFNVAQAGVITNVVFAVLNLIPVLPLDGGRVLASLLPNKASLAYQSTERYGMIILILLIVTGVLGAIMAPLVNLGVASIYSIFGLK